jgi:hypothetical protein
MNIQSLKSRSPEENISEMGLVHFTGHGSTLVTLNDPACKIHSHSLALQDIKTTLIHCVI